jgi:putative DNA primase/helicase
MMTADILGLDDGEAWAWITADVQAVKDGKAGNEALALTICEAHDWVPDEVLALYADAKGFEAKAKSEIAERRARLDRLTKVEPQTEALFICTEPPPSVEEEPKEQPVELAPALIPKPRRPAKEQPIDLPTPEPERKYIREERQEVNQNACMDFVYHFLNRNYSWEFGDICTLWWFNRDFYSWDGQKYGAKTVDSLKSELYKFIPTLWRRVKDGKGAGLLEPHQPGTDLVHQIIEALKAKVNLELESVPAWIGGGISLAGDIKEYLSMFNGILHLPTKTMHPHTPQLFTLSGVDYSYGPERLGRSRWLTLLREYYEDDRESIDCIQEIFGLCLTDEVKYQKGFIIKGPTRSGKGTIFGHVLPAVIGRSAFVGMSLNKVVNDFGTANLIGKRVMVAPDARVESRKRTTVTEFLLSTIAGDPDSHNRKHKSYVETILTTKIIICTNEIPQLFDTTGTIAGRFITLVMTKSYLDKEDLDLADKILEEKAGILDWAIDGYIRLKARGRFKQPKSGMEFAKQLRLLSSQILSFIEDCCIRGEGEFHSDAIFAAYQAWCQANNIQYVPSKSVFAKQLLDACPEITKTHPRTGEIGRPPTYVGISPREKPKKSKLDVKNVHPEVVEAILEQYGIKQVRRI